MGEIEHVKRKLKEERYKNSTIRKQKSAIQVKLSLSLDKVVRLENKLYDKELVLLNSVKTLKAQEEKLEILMGLVEELNKVRNEGKIPEFAKLLSSHGVGHPLRVLYQMYKRFPFYADIFKVETMTFYDVLYLIKYEYGIGNLNERHLRGIIKAFVDYTSICPKQIAF